VGIQGGVWVGVGGGDGGWGGGPTADVSHFWKQSSVGGHWAGTERALEQGYDVSLFKRLQVKGRVSG
jgi:hypothetical protein